MQNALHQALFVCTFEVLYVGAHFVIPILRKKAGAVSCTG
jgi:hypothetical protein